MMRSPRRNGAFVLLTVLAALPAWAREAAESYGRTALQFEAVSEPGSEVRYRARAEGMSVGFRQQGVDLESGGEAIRLRFAGANPTPALLGLEPGGAIHYHFPGGRLSAATHRRVEYRDLYPGIGLVWYGSRRQLKYDFTVAPGADPDAISLQVEGSHGAEVADNGDLVLTAGNGEIRHHRPIAYQDCNGEIRAIEVRYRVRDNRVGFETGEYDRTRTLVIDPVVTYAALFGGALGDQAYGIAVDSAGSAYVVGETWSLYQSGRIGALSGTTPHAFVTKLDPTGTRVEFTAVIGGSGRDSGRGIQVDGAGNIYIAGFTTSADFPVTSGGFRSTSTGLEDAFVAKIGSAGASLVYSSLLSGNGADFAAGIAVDSAGQAHVTGYTSSRNFPVTAGAVQRTYAGGPTDGFAVKLNAAGSALLYSTYLGGSGSDSPRAIAVAADGAASIAGYTDSTDFPVQSPVQGARGSGDAFVSRLSAGGGSLLFSTYLGGSGSDYATAVAVDGSGSAYVTGGTSSSGFPTTAGAAQPAVQPGYDAFLAKFSGSTLVFCTALGGRAAEEATGIAVDATGVAYISGFTYSSDLPGLPTSVTSFGARDAFLSAVSADGRSVLWSILLGGSGDDVATAVALDPAANVYVAGHSGSPDFLGSQRVRRDVDSFVAKVSSDLPPSVLAVTPASGSGSSQTFAIQVAHAGGSAMVLAAEALVIGNDGARCHVFYGRGNPSVLFLATENESLWLGPVALGTAGTLQHSYCSVSAGSSAVTASGTVLTLQLSLSFTAAFGGQRDIYAIGYAANGQNSGWQKKGTWTVPMGSRTPAVDSVTPASGSGTSQVFSIQVSHLDGNASITAIEALITANDGARCHFFYGRGSPGPVYLAAEDESRWLGPSFVGSGPALQQSYCAVNAATASLAASGTSLTLSLPLAFSSAFGGPRDIYVLVYAGNGTNSGWQKKAVWTVPLGLSAPAVDSVAPASGSGSSQVFTVQVSHPDGNASINAVEALLTGSDGARCHLFFLRSGAGSYYLAAADESRWLGPAGLGSASVLQHSYCALNAAAGISTSAGTRLSVAFPLSFALSFAGQRDLYVIAYAYNGTNSGWRKMAVWTAGN